MQNESITFLAGQAVTGLLAANPDLANHPEDLAKKTLKVAIAINQHINAQEEGEEN